MGRWRKHLAMKSTGDNPAADLHELILLCEDREAPLPVNVLKEKLKGANGLAMLHAHGKDETLLHVVCSNKHVTLDLVKFLVDLYPEAVRHQSTVGGSSSSPGWYPLHQACYNHHIPLEIVEYLVDLFPEALMMRVYDLTPLACIIDSLRGTEGRSLRLDLVRYIITKAPECVRLRVERHSTTVIHLACMLSSPSLGLVQMLIQQWPEALSIFSDNGHLPLHALLSGRPRLFCKCSTPLDLVQFLIDGFPDAVRTLSMEGIGSAFPLHMACEHQDVSLEVMQLLVEAYPEAVSRQAGFVRNYPLHYLLMGGTSQKLEVVHYLVEQFPNALQMPNQEGALPLHYAVGQSLEIVQYLVEQNPDAAQNSDCFLKAARHGKLEVIQYLHGLNPRAALVRDSYNNTCLHRACEFQEGNVDIFEYLLRLNPNAIGISNDDGDLPLHIACQQGMGEAVVKFLLARNPGAIKVKNNDHCLPLHLASNHGFWHILRPTPPSSGSIFPMLINAYPEAIRQFDNEGRLPLHYACKQGVSITDIKLLVKLYPSSIRVVSPKHGLPIHEATTRRHNGLPLVQYLEEMAPESLETYVAGIGLPLHFAVQWSSVDVFAHLLVARYRNHNVPPYFHAILQDHDLLDKGSIADFLLEEYSVHIADRDSMGRAPLHVAVSTNLETSFIQKLIDRDTNAVQLRDKSNSMPLHYALRHGDPANAVGLLLDQYAEAVKVADINNFLPLHVACRHGASLDVVKRLVELYEESVAARDNEGETPLHKACRGGHLALVEFLAEKNMPSVRVPNSNGTLPIILLCQSSGKQQRRLLDDENATTLGTIWKLLRKHPEAILPATVRNDISSAGRERGAKRLRLTYID